jgi:hypothetical protein
MRRKGQLRLLCAAVALAAAASAAQARTVEGLVVGNSIRICGRAMPMNQGAALVAAVRSCDGKAASIRRSGATAGGVIVRFDPSIMPLVGIHGPRPKHTGTPLDEVAGALYENGVLVMGPAPH